MKIILSVLLLVTMIGCAPAYYYDPGTESINQNLSSYWCLDIHQKHLLYKVTRDWDTCVSEKRSIVGCWEGQITKNKKITFHFDAEGTCEWSTRFHTIKGRYEIQEEDKLYRIKMYGFNTWKLDDVEFHGILKLKDENMMFYGVPIKDPKEIAFLPYGFPTNALLLKKMDLTKSWGQQS